MNRHEVLLRLERIDVDVFRLRDIPTAFCNLHHPMEHERTLCFQTIAAVLTALCAGLGCTAFWPLFCQNKGRQVDVRILMGERQGFEVVDTLDAPGIPGQVRYARRMIRQISFQQNRSDITRRALMRLPGKFQ